MRLKLSTQPILCKTTPPNSECAFLRELLAIKNNVALLHHRHVKQKRLLTANNNHKEYKETYQAVCISFWPLNTLNTRLVRVKSRPVRRVDLWGVSPRVHV